MEEKTVDIAGQKYNYKLRRRFRVKYLRLAIHHDGTLVVTAPKIYPVFMIKQFIVSKAQWIVEALQKQASSDSIFRLQHSAKEINEYKKQTRKLVTERLEYYNQFYNYKYNRIFIRNQSTRWGSCSSSKNLNFNYRLILLPAEFANYIIVHELCHLQEMNHSVNFWALVEKTFPDYKKLKKKLKNLS